MPRSRMHLSLTLVLVSAFATGVLAEQAGDCNQDSNTNILDALVAARAAAGIDVVDPSLLLHCDLNADQAVNILDALAIARIGAGIVPAPMLPVEVSITEVTANMTLVPPMGTFETYVTFENTGSVTVNVGSITPNFTVDPVAIPTFYVTPLNGMYGIPPIPATLAPGESFMASFSVQSMVMPATPGGGVMATPLDIDATFTGTDDVGAAVIDDGADTPASIYACLFD